MKFKIRTLRETIRRTQTPQVVTSRTQILRETTKMTPTLRVTAKTILIRQAMIRMIRKGEVCRSGRLIYFFPGRLR